MATMTVPFRVYDLPWSGTEEERRRLRRLLTICFGITLLLGILIPLLPVPQHSVQQAEPVPPRFARLVIERPPAPPPPPPPAPPRVEPQPQSTPQTRPRPAESVPVDRAAEARRRAAQSLSPLQDQLAALRDSAVLEKAAQARNLTGRVGEATRAERSLITSRVGTGSGGINTANLSRGYGGGAGALAGHETTQVTSELASAARDNVRRAAGGNRAARSEEEIAMVFDRNKGAIHAIYTRALRDNPDLRGKVVLELTITPEGQISRCEIVSSELNDPELERRLVARIKLFRFEAKDVGTITVTKPIDFFPA